MHHLSSNFFNNPWFCKRLYPSVCVASEMLAQLSGERLKQDPNYEKKMVLNCEESCVKP